MNTDIHVLARAILIKDDHILLAFDPRTKPNHYYEQNVFFYYLPGGHIEFKESAKTALVREMREETGLHATIMSFCGIIEHSWKANKASECCHTHEVNLIFTIDVSDIDPSTAIEQKEDHVAFKWVPFDDLDSIDLRPKILKDVMPKWLKSPVNSTFESVMI